MSDEDMVREVRRCMLDPTGPTPSIESCCTPFCRIVSSTTVTPTILAVSNRVEGEAICRELYGDRVIYLPWIMPGFPLAERWPMPFRIRRDRRSFINMVSHCVTRPTKP